MANAITARDARRIATQDTDEQIIDRIIEEINTQARYHQTYARFWGSIPKSVESKLIQLGYRVTLHYVPIPEVLSLGRLFTVVSW